jgi:ubiquinol-cytochrome c reductase cytochrome b subunit
MARLHRVLEWLDDRTGWRAGRAHLLDEPIAPGVGWWFVTGSVLLMLLAVQLITGVGLAMYYVPSPDHAYNSVRFITEQVTFGRVLRGLHVFGASFIVIAAVIHMLRVIALGSYKKPREVTWMLGVVLLLIILAFALSGYLLPWDQKAYWATTVTINIARGGPLGSLVAGILQGGDALGALALVRWYAAHVFLLPAALISLTVAHVYLMRRHGISGPVVPVAGEPRPFYPFHVLKDTIAGAAVFALLLAFAIVFRAPLDAAADPTDASYVPRPEWYFLSLFQLLKYFPGRLEPVATIVIPALVVGGLLLLPFLDRGPSRRLLDRPLVAACVGVVGTGIVVLTILGLRDSPAAADAPPWGPLAIAGEQFVQDSRCQSCHVTGGSAPPISELRLEREPDWLFAHVRDPEMLVPGQRQPPPDSMSEGQARAVVSYMSKLREGGMIPAIPESTRTASLVIGRYCSNCHLFHGEGSPGGIDLSTIGRTRDAAWLRAWVANPEAVEPYTNMPSFGDVLTEKELAAVADYLAAAK